MDDRFIEVFLTWMGRNFWDALVATGTLALAVFAWKSSKDAAKAANESKRFMDLQLENERLNIRPRLYLKRLRCSSFETDQTEGFALRNLGIGPADNISYRFFLDGKEIDGQKKFISELRHILNCGFEKAGLRKRGYGAIVRFHFPKAIGVGSDEDILWIDKEWFYNYFTQKYTNDFSNAVKVTRAALELVGFSVEYKSPHGEPFTVDYKGLETEEVR